jgi:hypothetical protein
VEPFRVDDAALRKLKDMGVPDEDARKCLKVPGSSLFRTDTRVQKAKNDVERALEHWFNKDYMAETLPEVSPEHARRDLMLAVCARRFCSFNTCQQPLYSLVRFCYLPAVLLNGADDIFVAGFQRPLRIVCSDVFVAHF